MNKSRLDQVIVSPRNWPGKDFLLVQPGDLTKFAAQGNGVYGFQKHDGNPIKYDSPHEANGGIVFFDCSLKKEDFEAFLRMMHIRVDSKDYAAFFHESEKPVKDRYFKQMRIISKFGLRFMFQTIDDLEYKNFEEQKLPLGNALWEFMNAEAHRFGTMLGDPRIEGKMGGDGYFAREKLSFGFMLENDYHRVYRIWSRAWLVTK